MNEHLASPVETETMPSSSNTAPAEVHLNASMVLREMRSLWWVVLLVIVLVNSLVIAFGVLAAREPNARAMLQFMGLPLKGNDYVEIHDFLADEAKAAFYGQPISFQAHPDGRVVIAAPGETVEQAVELVARAVDKLMASYHDLLGRLGPLRRENIEAKEAELASMDRTIEALVTDGRYLGARPFKVAPESVPLVLSALIERRIELNHEIAEMKAELPENRREVLVLLRPTAGPQEYFPNWTRNLILATIFGFAFGVFVVLLNSIDRTIKLTVVRDT